MLETKIFGLIDKMHLAIRWSLVLLSVVFLALLALHTESWFYNDYYVTTYLTDPFFVGFALLVVVPIFIVRPRHIVFLCAVLSLLAQLVVITISIYGWLLALGLSTGVATAGDYISIIVAVSAILITGFNIYTYTLNGDKHIDYSSFTKIRITHVLSWFLFYFAIVTWVL